MTVLRYPGPPWRAYEGVTGEALVYPEVSGPEPARTITVVLFGRLRSGRDLRFNGRTARDVHRAWVREYTGWYNRLVPLGVHQLIRDSVAAWALAGFKARVTCHARRRRPQIRDFKNLVVGFDQGVIDGLVHAGLLLDDSTDHLQLTFDQETGSPEYIWLRFERGGTCPERVTHEAARRVSEGRTAPDGNAPARAKNERLFGGVRGKRS